VSSHRCHDERLDEEKGSRYSIPIVNVWSLSELVEGLHQVDSN
jgi:hypothetical protein